MIRSDLVRRLAKDNPDLKAREVERTVDVFLKEIVLSLAADGRVEIRGFGTFSTRSRDPRDGRNPRTGDAVLVNAKRVPYFRPSKKLRERLCELTGVRAVGVARKWHR